MTGSPQPPQPPTSIPAIRAADDPDDPDSPRMRLTAHDHVDLLAMAAVVLGYHPYDAVAMLTFGGTRQFHAGLAIPDGPTDDLPAMGAWMAEMLLGPAQRHAARRVALMIHTDDVVAGDAVAAALEAFADRAGIEVVALIGVRGERYYDLLTCDPDARDVGVRFDRHNHPFIAQAVLEGRVVRDSRRDLVQEFDADPDAVAAVEAEVRRLEPWRGGRPPTGRYAAAEAAWARKLVRDHLVARAIPSDPELARLLRGMTHKPIRDAVCTTIEAPRLLQSVDLWTHVLRRAPEALVPAPACLLAYAAWQSGDGASAWCALDRCAAVDPDYRLHTLLAGALSRAVPPSAMHDDPWPDAGSVAG